MCYPCRWTFAKVCSESYKLPQLVLYLSYRILHHCTSCLELKFGSTESSDSSMNNVLTYNISKVLSFVKLVLFFFCSQPSKANNWRTWTTGTNGSSSRAHARPNAWTRWAWHGRPNDANDGSWTNGAYDARFVCFIWISCTLKVLKIKDFIIVFIYLETFIIIFRTVTNFKDFHVVFI